jgi:hypothetical protein
VALPIVFIAGSILWTALWMLAGWCCIDRGSVLGRDVAMWSWLASFLGGPIINGLISAYKAKLDAGNTAGQIAATLAARELAVEQREAEVTTQYKIAMIGHWYEPTQLLGYIMVVYVGKVIVWDKVLGYWTEGNTDSIGGAVGEWAGLIIMFLVGKAGIENVARILKR